MAYSLPHVPQNLNFIASKAVNYVDDLKSIAGSLPALQEQANLVSAFALVFGLDQSQLKFRAYHFPFSTPGRDPSRLHQMAIQVHGPNWVPTQCPIRAVGSLKDLDFHIGMDLGGDQQYQVTKQRLVTALEAMKFKFC